MISPVPDLPVDPGPADDTGAAALFPGDDPTQTLLRAIDWRSTPLGPVTDWPQPLRSAIETVMPSRMPMMLFWGPQLIQIYNDAFAALIGTKHPRAIGQPAPGSYPEAWSALGPLVDGVVERGTASYSPNMFVPLHRHGYLEETYFTFSYSPVRHREQVAGIFVAAMETTGHVVAERRLRVLHRLGTLSSVEVRSAAQVCTAALDILAEYRNGVPFAAIQLLDPDRRRLRMSSSFGMTDATVRKWAEIAGPDDASPTWRVVTSGRPEVVDGLRERFDARLERSVIGDAVPDMAMIQPLVDRVAGRPIGVIVLGVNPYRALDGDYCAFFESIAQLASVAVTDALALDGERHRAARLAEADTTKTRFLQNVSHEFRTPLTLLLGSLDELRRDGGDGRRGLDLAEENAHHLHRLVESLLDVGKAEAGRLRPELEPTDLAALTRRIAGMFTTPAGRAGLALTVDAPGVSDPVLVDREMWIKVLSNLLVNAIKFTPAGTITVRLTEQPDTMRLEVTDTGVGIAADDLPQIFDRFHQVPGARTRGQQGIGIGLSLVADIVEALDGRVDVVSTVDVGTTFTVEVPIRSLDGAPARPLDPDPAIAAAYLADAGAGVDRSIAVRPRGDGAAPVSGTILLIEDNDELREYLTTLLAGDGWRVTAVADVPSALSCASTRPDIALVDVMLPGADGLTLVRALREVPHVARMPVIVLTALGGTDAVVAGLTAGADDYVVKPFAPAELLARVRVHVELARLRESAVTEAEQTVAQLRVALRSNRRIAAAVGMLMSRLSVSDAEAFDRLAAVSQRENRKVRDVAEEVLRLGTLPDPV